MSIRRQAIDAAIDVVNGVARTIADEAESRRAEPDYWANFHQAQLHSLPRWRWLARLRHRRLMRRYYSFSTARRRVAR